MDKTNSTRLPLQLGARLRRKDLEPARDARDVSSSGTRVPDDYPLRCSDGRQGAVYEPLSAGLLAVCRVLRRMDAVSDNRDEFDWDALEELFWGWWIGVGIGVVIVLVVALT